MNDEPCELRRLSISDERIFLSAIAEWSANPGFVFAPDYDPSFDFKSYIELLAQQERGENLRPGYVPHTVLFGFSGGRIIGRAGFRHYLKEFLEKVGGHIGYGVLPDSRLRGFATSMLRQTLPYAREMGLTKVLVTCDDDNVGSYKVIEKCGGTLENVIEVASDGQVLKKRRYWIDL